MKKMLALVLAVTLGAMTFSSCANLSGTQSPSSKTASKEAASAQSGAEAQGGTIKLLTHYKDQIDAIKGDFEKETGIKVEVDLCSFEELTDTYEIILSSGSSEYDALVVDSPNAAAYKYRGYLEPLTSYFTTDEINQFSPALIKQGTVDNTFYCAPLGDSSTILFYNKNLMNEAGIEWNWEQYNGETRITWEELTDLAKKIQSAVDPDGKKGITGVEFGQVSLTYMMNMLPNSRGGANISEDGLSVSGVLDSEPWLTSLKWYQDMVGEGVFSRGISVGETYNNFYVDKAAFIIMTADSIPYCESAGMTADEYGFTYVPAFKGQESKVATGCGNWAMSVNVNSKNKDAAGEFVRWITYGAGNDLFLKQASMVPNMESRFTEQAAADNPILPLAKYEASNTAVVRAVTPGFNEYSAALNTMWEDIRNGTNVEEAVANTITQVDKALAAYKK